MTVMHLNKLRERRNFLGKGLLQFRELVPEMGRFANVLNDIRLQKRQYDPGQELASNVAKLEQRLVLNSTWKFPTVLLGTLPGQHGPTILTSRSYEQAQRMVDRAFNNFAGSLAKVQQKVIAGKMSIAHAERLVGIDRDGINPHSLLGRLESSLRKVEAKIPYGKGSDDR